MAARFFIDILSVCGNRVLADHEVPGDLLISQSFGHLLQNTGFSFSKEIFIWLVDGLRKFGKVQSGCLKGPVYNTCASHKTDVPEFNHDQHREPSVVYLHQGNLVKDPDIVPCDGFMPVGEAQVGMVIGIFYRIFYKMQDG